MAFGTFDIFHPGHVYYLTEAERLGDTFTIVIARDERVAKLKWRKPKDDEEIRRYIRSELDSDFRIYECTNGREGLETILKEKPDLVISDVMMPEMDGYESTREIRKDRKLKDIPVIAVTAKAMMGDRAKCISAGASDYITKPVDIDQLLSLLRVWLYESGNRK